MSPRLPETVKAPSQETITSYINNYYYLANWAT